MRVLAIKLILLALCAFNTVSAQLSGYIYSQADNKVLTGITVRALLSNKQGMSDANGQFKLSDVKFPDTLLVSGLGYEDQHVPVVASEKPLQIFMLNNTRTIEEIVVHTGYQSLPRERATGSFVQINRETLNQSVSSSIMERLEGVVSGLYFNKRNVSENLDAYAVPSVRGLSTINSSGSPLIVLDNFPYEGALSNINPNDIESVTFLKDAAAASIWGAQAGNGVIVIQTRKAEKSQSIRVGVNSNLTHSARPDLYRSRDFIPAEDFIRMELDLFSKNMYTISDRRVLSPVIEAKLLGVMTDEEILVKYSSMDIRKDAERYLYQNELIQRYGFDVNSRGKHLGFRLSAGLDQNRTHFVGNDNSRLTLNSSNQFNLAEKIHMDVGLFYVKGIYASNGFRINDLRPAGLYPYASLMDDHGNHLALPQEYRSTYIDGASDRGLLDWYFRPLDELRLSDRTERRDELRINTGLKYLMPVGFDVEGRFQYQSNTGERNNLQQAESYHVRNLVNRFTQSNGSRPFPSGDILTKDYNGIQSYSGRMQVNYNSRFHKNHQLVGLIGSEIRQVGYDGYALQVYGYNDEILTTVPRVDYITRYATLPDGSSQIPTPSTSLQSKIDRYISYYGNLSYAYDHRYVISASARKDASNLFGVKTNQRSVPLWSTGLAWNVSNEAFFQKGLLEELKLRMTYGYAGNVDRSTAAFPIGRYSSDSYTGFPIITISNPGNPQLRWEKIRTVNLGIDYTWKGQRLRGTVEYFDKFSTDLIGNNQLDPTSGYYVNTNYSYRTNYATLRTRGVDFMLSSKNTQGAVRWETDILVNYVSEKVKKFDFSNSSAMSYMSTLSPVPREGYPVYGLYSLPWHGLNPANGNPQVIVDGDLSEDYASFVRGLSLKDLIYHGSQIPTLTGSLRNHLHYGELSLRFNLTWKSGYYFRANSVSYNEMLSDWNMHADYMHRWQNPGDERITNVPSMPTGTVSNRDLVYLRSELHAEKGDHIRLQDIQFSYMLNKLFRKYSLPLQSGSIYVYAKDLGLLWAANGKGLDPDRPYVQTLPPASISFGLNLNF